MQLPAVADRVPEMADAGPRENVHVSPSPQQQHAKTDDQLAGPRVHRADHTDFASVLLQSTAGGSVTGTRDEIVVSTGDRSVCLPVQTYGALRHRMVSCSPIRFSPGFLILFPIRVIFVFIAYSQSGYICLDFHRRANDLAELQMGKTAIHAPGVRVRVLYEGRSKT